MNDITEDKPKTTKDKPRTIIRKKVIPLTDAEKYKVLKDYSLGIPIAEIAKELGRDKKALSKFIQGTLKDMNTIRETNVLVNTSCSAEIKRAIGKNPTKFLTPSFLSLAERNAEAYAYYFAQTGDNKFAIIQSGLDIGISKNVAKVTKDYVYRIRGQFLRDIPIVSKLIRDDQDRRIQEYHIEKPLVQMELMHQIEELKEIVVNEPRQRNNLLKAIELLGRSLGAFTDNIKYEETDAKTGLEILMERAKGEAKEVTVYESK